MQKGCLGCLIFVILGLGLTYILGKIFIVLLYRVLPLAVGVVFILILFWLIGKLIKR